MIIRNVYFIILGLLVSASAFADSLFVKYDPSAAGHENINVYIGKRGPYHLCAQNKSKDCKGRNAYLAINPYRDREITLPQYNLTLKTSVGLFRRGGCNYVVTVGRDFSVIDVNNYGQVSCSYHYSRHQDTKIQVFKNVHMNYSQRNFSTQVNFPPSQESFSKVTFNFHLRCPSGGCDPWDRWGTVYIIDDNGQKNELFRFITPYGVGVDLSEDVTDLRPLLTGKKTLQLFIDTWVGSGWLVSADVTFKPGTPQKKVLKVIPVFTPQAFYYGQDYPPQFLSKEVTIPAGVKSAVLRTYLAGHGQGNTQNCAEFCNKKQTITIDSTTYPEKSIWRDNCSATKTIGRQRGNYTPSRAGWCPGDKVYPWLTNISSLSPEKHTITWRPQAYTNYRNKGYNNGSHTAPFYQISSLLVLYGS